MYVIPCSFSTNLRKKESSKDYSEGLSRLEVFERIKHHEEFIRDILTVEEEKSVLK